MKQLKSIETDEVQLVVIECDCGFHIGLDCSYLDQKDEIKINCPNCNALIDTAVICPE